MYLGMNYVNGDFTPHRSDFVSVNPATEEVIGQFPASTPAECDEALAAARRQFPSWRNVSRPIRAEFFDKLAQLIRNKTDYIARVISLETGKTLNESRAEVIEALHMVQYTFSRARFPHGEIVGSELSERESYTITKPKGVVLSISPWNFPFAIGGFWTAAPAIMEGNTVILKPSEETPMVGQIIAGLYHEAGFPPGVFNLIHGTGIVGEYLLSKDVDHICFTGSVEVGKKVRLWCAQSQHKTCSCEMGSKSAVMVFEDADLDLALSACINSAFKLSGQRCVSSGRMLIHRDIYDKFCDRFVEMASGARIGDPLDMDGQMGKYLFGPLISDVQRSRVELFNNSVMSDPDAKVLLQGKRQGDKGYFLTPHVYQVEWADKVYLRNEVFGPHVALVPFNDLNDAIRIYNDTNYGLSLAAVTNDYRRHREIRDRCDAGMYYFNLGSIGAESHFPFGGVKASGYGGGSAAGTFENVVHKVTVSVNHARKVTFPQGLK